MNLTWVEWLALWLSLFLALYGSGLVADLFRGVEKPGVVLGKLIIASGCLSLAAFVFLNWVI